MPKITIHINTGFPACKHRITEEIDDQDWNEMSEAEREEMLDELVQDEINNHIEGWAEVQE